MHIEMVFQFPNIWTPLISVKTLCIFHFHVFLDNNWPVLTDQVLVESLKTTNAYCLQGIKNNFNESGKKQKTINPFPGLELAVSVFEEVLMWPILHSHIFNQSPLRNQAGILLFGAPGTGGFKKFK